MAGGFGMSVKITGNVARNLRDIQYEDIPAAKGSAFSRAGNTGLSKASTAVAAMVGVPKWMIRGVGGTRNRGRGKIDQFSSGTKSSGSRVGRTRYIKSIDGIFLFFRSRDINPGGTKAKEANWTATKTGYRINGVKKKFDNTYAVRSKYPARYIVLYKRGTDGASHQVTVRVGDAAVALFRTVCRATVPPAFVKRFEHEYNRRIKRRATR